MSLLLSAAAVANSESTVASQSAMPQVAPTPVTEPESGFLNPRFQHRDLELALKDKSLSSGAKGEAVKRVQSALLDLGFALPSGTDGAFGGQTVAALKAFQSSRGIAQTGKIDSATLKSLDKVSPEPNKKVWQDSRAAQLALAPMPVLNGHKARVLVDLSEHRLTLYNQDGIPERVFPVASGAWGTQTDPGVKIVHDKVADPSPIAWALWPESQGGAFGTRMLDLSWFDPATGVASGSGEELHGTYARNSIGSFASHGCVRMQNEDVEWVYQNLDIGDIVVIQP